MGILYQEKLDCLVEDGELIYTTMLSQSPGITDFSWHWIAGEI